MISSDIYIITNGASRTCLLVTYSKDAAHFVHHNTLDSRLAFVSVGAWNSYTKNSELDDYSVELINNKWFQLINRKFVSAPATDLLKEQRARAKMLTDGYIFLQNVIEPITTNINSSSYFLSLDDIKYFPDITVLAPVLAEATGLNLEIAKKQLLIEKESLLEIIKYKKYVTWKYTRLLLNITTDEEFQEWKDTSRLLARGLGRIPRPEL
jgi:hypothetical protein